MTSSANRIDRDDYHPFRVGRRLIVVPAWLEPELDPDLIPLRLDPGTTFGTGTHATTKLCLAALERHLKPGDAVIDLGTGSGILAIAAAELGASSVLAVDTDPESVRVATVNVELNGLAEIVNVQAGSLVDVVIVDRAETPAALVVANILSNILVSFFEQGLIEVIAPGGLLILSGILRSQTPDINAALRRHGLEKLAQEQLEEWVCIIARKQ
jgi:ribosomal protein L11 methyltransferase